MAQRIPRPACTINAAQPDGTSNGLARVAKHFLGPDFTERRFLVAEVERTELTHKDATGRDIATIGIVAIAMPDAQQDLAAILKDTLDAEHQSTAPLFQVTDRGRYEAALAEWAEKGDKSKDDIRDAWMAHFGDSGGTTGPVGAELPLLAEFVLEVCGISTDDLPEVKAGEQWGEGYPQGQPPEPADQPMP